MRQNAERRNTFALVAVALGVSASAPIHVEPRLSPAERWHQEWETYFNSSTKAVMEYNRCMKIHVPEYVEGPTYFPTPNACREELQRANSSFDAEERFERNNPEPFE